MNQRQAAGLVLRIEHAHQFLQPLIAHGGADLDADGLQCREIFHVRAIDLRCAHADPGHVGGEVIPAVLAGDCSGLRLFIQQMQALVAGEEVHARGLMHALAAQGFEEIQRIADGTRDALVGLT